MSTAAGTADDPRPARWGALGATLKAHLVRIFDRLAGYYDDIDPDTLKRMPRP